MLRKIVIVGCLVLAPLTAGASPMPPGPECFAAVEAQGLVPRAYDRSALNFREGMEACRVRLLSDPVQLRPGYEGQDCRWRAGDVIEGVIISGGFKQQPRCEFGEIFEGILEPAGDEGGVWVNLAPLKVSSEKTPERALLFVETTVSSMFGGGSSFSLYNTGELVYESSSGTVKKANLTPEEMIVVRAILRRLAAADDCAKDMLVMDASKGVRIILDGKETTIDNPDMNSSRSECYRAYDQLQSIYRLLGPEGK